MEKRQRNFATWLIYLAHTDITLQDSQSHNFIEKNIELKPSHFSEALKKEKLRQWRRYAIILSTFFLVITTVWTAGNIYLSKIKLGQKVVSSHQSNIALQAEIKNQAGAYKLKIIYPDSSSKSFSLEQMGIAVDSAATVVQIRQSQHQFVNWLQWWRPMPAQLSLLTGSKLNSFITQNATQTVQPAKDASISFNQGKVEVKDSTLGLRWGLIGPIPTLTDAASSLQSKQLPLRTLAIRPAITSSDLASSQAKLQKILGQNVSFMIGSKTIRASAGDIADWLELTPKEPNKPIDITVNSGKVLAYINRIAAAAIHPPRDQVEVVRPDGTKAILVAGVNGTDVINKSAAAADVTQKLLANKGVSESLSIQNAPFKIVSSKAYNKWIEVDTTNKRLYAYEEGTLLKTFLISAGAPLTPTVTGEFSIYSKYSQQDMRGRNVDGSGYFQPHVPWVNYFYQGYAIHGNYWRPLSWFGNINSSHGCVGIVDNDAEWLYSWAPIGTKVIIHT